MQLVLNSGGTRILEKGDTLIGEIDGGITELLTQEGLSAANQLTALVNRINNVLEPFAEKTDAIAAAIDNFKKLSDGLVVTNELAQTSMKQFNLRLEYVTDSLVAAMGGVKPLMDEYKKLGEKLNAVDVESRLERIDSVLYSTQSFLARLNSDDGTLGKLLTNDSLYNTLNRTMADLDSLMIDLRYNPKRYMHFSIFGRKNRPPADSRKSNR